MRIRNHKIEIGIGLASLLFIVMLVGDFISTSMMGPLIQYLESNILYKYIGLTGIVIINLFLVLFFYWIYRRAKQPSTRFIYLNVLVTLIVVRIMVVFNNVQIYLNKPKDAAIALELAKQVTQAQKIATVMYVAKLAFLPFLIGVITYFIWQLDHKAEVKK